MSASSKNDSSNRPGCDSDGEFSVASSYGSEVQDCRKRKHQPQIQTSAWVLCCQITMDQLHSNSGSMAAGLEGNVENEDRITKINTRLQGLFGARFEIFFGKLHETVMYFVVFCNLINIMRPHGDRSCVVIGWSATRSPHRVQSRWWSPRARRSGPRCGGRQPGRGHRQLERVGGRCTAGLEQSGR